MSSHPPSSLRPAHRRPGVLHMLAMLLLAGLLWSWGEARAMPQPAMGSELEYLGLQETGPDHVLQVATAQEVDEVCRRPASAKTQPVERVLNEVGDLEVLPRQPVWLLPAQAAPVQGPQPLLQEAVLPPLLRPPARRA